MGHRISLLARLLAAFVIGTTVLVVAEPVVAVTAHQTLADRRPVGAGPVTTTFPIDHLGVIWDTDGDHAAGPQGSVRFHTEGSWGPWIPLVEDAASAPGQWASALVAGGDADAYQVRGIPAGARSPRAVAINTTDGARVQVGERRGGAAGALASSMCRSRADWGADESIRFTTSSSGTTETWAPTHHPVQALTVHHTDTANGQTGAAAEGTMQAIYRYHAIDRGWGDIGYQYLVDAAGVVYEGRHSGTTSTSCRAGGDGSDFGHEAVGDGDRDGTPDEMVTGAHVAGWNSGNMGVALLGSFTTVQPASAAVDGLEGLLAELSARHGLDAAGTVSYVNPVNSTTKKVRTISAHRDWEATACPGDRLYALLPDLRTAVAEASTSTTSTTTSTSTTTTSTTSTTTTTSTPPATTTTLSATSIAPSTLGVGNTVVTVAGTGFVAGASVSFTGGKGPAPTTGPVRIVDDRTLEATVTVPAKGAKGWWDVLVRVPDGRSTVCSRCAYVQR